MKASCVSSQKSTKWDLSELHPFANYLDIYDMVWYNVPNTLMEVQLLMDGAADGSNPYYKPFSGYIAYFKALSRRTMPF